MPQLTRKQISQIYRPVGPKIIQTGVAFNPAVGGAVNLAQSVDLTLPILGFQIVIRGRDIIGVANMTSIGPEGYLNLGPRILITGTNARQAGNVTLWDIDFATAFVMQHMVLRRAGIGNLSTGGGAVTANTLSSAGLPFPAASFGAVAQATYDWEYVLTLPSYPVGCNRAQRPGYAIRAEEWGNSLQVQLTFPAQANGVAGALGTDAAGTTHTFSSYGGGGTPTLDFYSLPFEMGLDIKNGVVPGFVTRVTKPVTAVLQAALGPNGPIVNLDTQPTSRVFVKVGTSTVGSAFATLSDANLTSVGIMLGGQKVVRQELPLRAHRQSVLNELGTEPIQGYTLIDFIQSGNPDSSYPGQLISAGTQFQLVGTAGGVANARAHIIQEEPIYAATGPLYTV